MNDNREARIMHNSISDMWKFLHKYIDNYPQTDEDWNTVISEYAEESARCFINGLDDTKGYSNGYSRKTSEFRMNIFLQAFIYLKEREGW